eukprot:8359985-Pyramimonas_sp.AAC.1
MAVPGGSSSIQNRRRRRTSAERRTHRRARGGLAQGHVEPPPPQDMRERSLALHLAKVSPSRTAAAWNAYLVSLTPYAARYAPPDVTQE